MSNSAAAATLSMLLLLQQDGKTHILVCMCQVPLGLVETPACGWGNTLYMDLGSFLGQ